MTTLILQGPGDDDRATIFSTSLEVNTFKNSYEIYFIKNFLKSNPNLEILTLKDVSYGYFEQILSDSPNLSTLILFSSQEITKESIMLIPRYSKKLKNLSLYGNNLNKDICKFIFDNLLNLEMLFTSGESITSVEVNFFFNFCF